MNLTLILVLAALASFRTAQMLWIEDGPFDVFAAIRGKLEVEKQDTWWQRGLSCPDCISFWTSLVTALMAEPAVPSASLPEFLLRWGAIAGVVLFLNRLISKITYG